MVTSGSDRPSRATLHPLVAVAAVLLGMGAMGQVAAPLTRFGLRPVLVGSELALLLPGLAAILLTRASLGASLGPRAPDRRTLLASLVLGGTLWLASLGLFELQYWLWAPPDGYLESFWRLHEALRPSGALDAALSVVAISIAPAACEELLFRGLVLPALLPSLGAPIAALGSALLFGLIHVDSVDGSLSAYRVPFALAVGLAFAACRIRTGSWLPSFASHAVLNTITFLAAPLAEEPSAGLPDPRPWLGALLLGLGAVASVLLFRLLARIDRPGGRA